jgi:membrane protein YqaA with SNARE-associated domain
MHDLFRHAFAFFARLGGFGLIGFGILDSSFLFLPLGNDLLLLVLTARKPVLFWYYALMATIGSLAGCTLTDAISRKLGEAGLDRLVSSRRLTFLQQRIEHHAWWALGTAALLPPPFPFTVFVIAAAALQTPRWKVLGAVGAGRLVRFFALGLLAVLYGRHILRLARRPEVEYFILGLAVVSILGSILSVMKWILSTRQRGPRPAHAEH